MSLCCFVVLAVFSVPFLYLHIPMDSGHAILIVACFHCSIFSFRCALLKNFMMLFLTLFWPCFTVFLSLPMLCVIYRLCLILRCVYVCNISRVGTVAFYAHFFLLLLFFFDNFTMCFLPIFVPCFLGGMFVLFVRFSPLIRASCCVGLLG